LATNRFNINFFSDGALRSHDSCLAGLGSAVHDYGSPLETHIDLLSSSLSCCLNRGLLRAECVGQVEFSFHDPIRIVFPTENSAENPLSLSSHDRASITEPLYPCLLFMTATSLEAFSLDHRVLLKFRVDAFDESGGIGVRQRLALQIVEFTPSQTSPIRCPQTGGCGQKRFASRRWLFHVDS
jgi:hypothetical protein